MDKLNDLRSKLSVPKNQFNKFGNFYYRNCEDILEGVKPFLVQLDLTLSITDDMILIGDRYYTKATATILDGDKILGSSTGWAREAESKKGMDSSQISGSTSSYARKYALNALLLLDDTKDADTNEQHKQTNQPLKTYPPTNKEEPFILNDAIKSIDALMKKLKCPEEYIADIQKNQYPKAKTRADFLAIRHAVQEEN